jgi:sugar lactone lactonase YvrE
MPAEQRDALVRELKLEALTPLTLTDRRRLQAELKLSRARGYAVDDEEIVLGVRCVGAPIVAADGRVRGAISIAGPAFRLSRERLDLLGPELAQAARRIGAQLDAQTSSPAAAAAAGSVEAVPGTWAFHGACPHWDAGCQRLLWVDTLGPAVHAWSEGQISNSEPDLGQTAGRDPAREPGQDQILLRLDAPIEAGLLLPGGDLALASGGSWLRLSPDGQCRPWTTGPARRVRALACRPGHDGGDDSDATALWGCLPDGERWRVGALSGADVLLGGWHLPEPVTALAWTPDGEQLYALAPDSGTLYAMREGQPLLRRLATVPKGSGRLAGLAVDADGGLWTALSGGWSLMRFTPDGELDRVVGLPVPHPTDLAIGGADGGQLFITSGRDDLSMEQLGHAPASGQLLRVGLVR